VHAVFVTPAYCQYAGIDIYVLTYVFIYICIHLYIYIYICISINVCKYIYMHVYANVYLYTKTDIRITRGGSPEDLPISKVSSPMSTSIGLFS